MSLFKDGIPLLRPSKEAVYAMGIFLATFVFWFTRPETEEELAADAETSKRTKD